MDTVTSVPKKVKDSVKASTSAVKRMSESMKNALSKVDSVKQSVANSNPCWCYSLFAWKRWTMLQASPETSKAPLMEWSRQAGNAHVPDYIQHFKMLGSFSYLFVILPRFASSSKYLRRHTHTHPDFKVVESSRKESGGCCGRSEPLSTHWWQPNYRF